MTGFKLLLAIGGLALVLVLLVALVVRRRARRVGDEPAFEESAETGTATYWGGDEWPRVIVRSHGRLRDVSRRPRPVEVVAVPVLSPWEPPQAS